VIVDGHITVGANRDVELSLERLLATMEELHIDRALVSPPEGLIPVRNREGNEFAAEAAERSGGRLLAYAVATPWLGSEGVSELDRAREGGARALKLDPALQGFSLLDGLADPLVEFAIESRWPVYVRSGTPPQGLPLQVAALATRFPEGAFVLGRSGTTDFGRDGPPALGVASNLYADTAHINWPVALASAVPETRVVFTTDAPFSDPAVELARVVEAPLDDETRALVLGGRLAALLQLTQ
jgi:predicted TIM-barrel fold metal-dependent hydrolase